MLSLVRHSKQGGYEGHLTPDVSFLHCAGYVARPFSNEPVVAIDVVCPRHEIRDRKQGVSGI